MLEQSSPSLIHSYPPLIPVAKWADYFPDPSVSALRWTIFKNIGDFSDRCIVRRGRRLLVDVESYFEWLRERGQDQ